ncbi:hypothetical protein CCR94_19395 [Rhodoblastus sphagnicola]|uniref:Glycosyltransferase RgtA/B/C/D-like domain-containing protein n=1 Tax=Rhodoblastus sphagnicola TaxID=333368 RepID=A0A2S6MZ70_9HYPH|nr:hypothetical protein [Rhodoblastus sphagnicola]MBB4198643.1 hypothetical protein [Rhodoblastus sphagnicola]PPQ27642.1 hypothetical protein CCR94_19395 [Rhodoblastus sphagnicola]
MTATDALPQAKPEAVVVTNRAVFNAAGLVFVAGNAIWATGLAAPAMIAVLIGCCGVAALLLTHRASGVLLDAPIDARLLGTCGLVALTLCLLGGETHLFWANADWLTRDAVLADVTRHVAPVYYRLGDETYFLRAPLGMYMIPGLVGHFFGLMAAHVVLLAQNALLLAIVLYLAAILGGGLAMALLLVVFSGLDLLPWFSSIIHDYVQTGVWTMRGEPEWWARLFQYSAHVTQIFYVPNHAFPGWFFALAVVAVARRELDLGALGAIFAALLFWSPLAPLAAPAFLVWFVWRDRAEAPKSLRFWLGGAAAACFLPVAVYLVADAGSISHDAVARATGFWSTYSLFLLVEIPHALFLAALWPRVRPELKPLLVISVGFLLLLPLYKFGPSNDLVMRGSIAPLFLLAFTFISTLLALEPTQRLARMTGLALVIVGAGGPLIEISEALLLPRYNISACNLITATDELTPGGVPTNYIAPTRGAPGWLLPQPTRDESFETMGAGRCWPDHPVLKDR